MTTLETSGLKTSGLADSKAGLDTSQSKYQQLSSDQRVNTHPCYSKDGHKYARMHLPVAPACNIQCNYCNRKFDCSNESRPGVVSKLLSPDQAVYRVQAVKARMPELKVIGIAGPGDPLANPKQTISALKAVARTDEDLHLCVSTNGLELPNMVDELVALGVNHITITINTLDPKVAANIYPWIYFDHKRWTGVEAGEILIRQQLIGLKLAADAGMLVKVNTVLIPGINDKNLDQLAKIIREKGALLHNIMPLISDPSHGTFFGLNNLPGPTEKELEIARKSAGIELDQMTHCQQCRADAIGRLSDSNCGENSQSCQDESKTDDSLAHKRTLRVAVASSQGTLIDTHFGHARQFLIYDISSNSIEQVDQREVETFCHGPTNCNEETNSAPKEHQLSKHLSCLSDCQRVLCSRVGIQPWRELEQQGTLPIVDFALFEIDTALSQIQQDVIQANKSQQLEAPVLKEVC